MNVRLSNHTLWIFLFLAILPAAPALRAAPTVTSITATPTSGYSATFTLTVSDPSGYQSITTIDLLMNNNLNGVSACYLALAPSGATTGSLYLVDDAGEAGGPWPAGSPISLPGSGSTANSQCSISGSGVSISGSGNSLTLTLPITFSNAFAGPKVLYVAALDGGGGNSGWQSAGTFTVGTPLFSVNPASGAGFSQVFTFTVTDPNGWQNGNVVDVLFNSAVNGQSACYFAYVPQAATLYLVDDAGDAGGPFAGSISFSGAGISGSGTGSGSASNSQCSISGSGASYSVNGTSLTLTIPLVFTASISGDRIFYLASRDNNWNSGWLAYGAWTVGQAPDFTITTTSSPDPLLIDPGSTNFRSVAVSFVAGFADTVNLGAQGLPAGWAWHFSNWSVSNGSPTSTLYINPPTTAQSGQYLITVVGAGSSTGITHMNQFTVQVANGLPPSFTLTATPNFQSVQAGGVASYNVSVTPQSQFTGAVALSVSGQPGSTFGCSPCSINTSGSALLTIPTTANTSARTYPITISGIANGWQVNLPATLVVNPATSQTLSVTPAVVTLAAGQVQQFSASLAGSNVAVTWAINSPAGAVAGALVSTGPRTAIYTAPTSIAGNQTIVVTATSQADNVTQGAAQIAQRAATEGHYVYNDNNSLTFVGGTCTGQCSISAISCSVDAVTGGGSDPDITVTAAPIPGNPGWWSVTYTADTKASSGARTARCSEPTFGTMTHPLTVYDATPNITGVFPDEIPYPGTTSVTFTGAGFGLAPPSLTFSPGGVSWQITSNSPTSFTALVTPSAPGSYSINVTSSGNSGNYFGGPQGSTSQSQQPATLMVQATPPPQPQITMNNTTVSGKDPQHPAVVSVGDQIQLVGSVANLPPGVSVTSQSWKVDGTLVANYLQSVSSATVTPFTDPGTANVTFYWIDGDTTIKAVTYSGTLSNGSPFSASAPFLVIRPSPVTFSGATTKTIPAINVGDQGQFAPGTIALNFGYEKTAMDPAITFNMSVNTTVGGQAALTQLVMFTTSYTKADGTQPQRTSGSAYVMDDGNTNVAQYASIIVSLQPGTSEWTEVDLPSIELTNLTAVTTNQQFQTYLMYRPPSINSIWVTLQTMTWNWNGAANRAQDGTWSVNSNGSSFSQNPSVTNSSVLPIWANYVSNIPIP